MDIFKIGLALRVALEIKCDEWGSNIFSLEKESYENRSIDGSASKILRVWITSVDIPTVLFFSSLRFRRIKERVKKD